VNRAGASASGLVTVVPAKSFSRAKSRLASCLDAQSRARLARSMLEHVLGVLDRYPLGEVVVATDCVEVAALAREHGARIAFDSGPGRLGTIVDRCLEQLDGAAQRALVLMADLPELGLADIDALLRAWETADVVAAPDLRRRCTNALLTPLPAPATRFGYDDSLRLHARDAQRAGLRFQLCQSRGLGLDIDDPEDLALFCDGSAQLGDPPSRFGLA
jgi:2-phospho-L-lactate guanylyltransferase